ncbi:MAG TPA: hypothetical protein VHY77_01160 [Acidimicrobiales bacterium]|jgi:hypothetical protein|nr:hypothetical protein [Acidimicrobiales bacterium]
MSSLSRGLRTKADVIRGIRPGDAHPHRAVRWSSGPQWKRLVPRPTVWIVTGLALIYAWFAALTTPFTARANVMTAMPLLTAALGAAWLGHIRRAPPKSGEEPARPTGNRLWPWWVGLGVVGAWELFSYLQLPRFEHPTFSSLYDSASRWQPLKAALFFGWLALGWAIVRAYNRVRT